MFCLENIFPICIIMSLFIGISPPCRNKIFRVFQKKKTFRQGRLPEYRGIRQLPILVMMLIIGMNMATTNVPIMAANIMIMIGSIIEVRASTAMSTSSS